MKLSKQVAASSVVLAAVVGLGRWVHARRTRRHPGPPPAPPRGDHPGWHLAPLASLDLETTGVDPAHDRVLSYALLGDGGGEIAGLVNPGVPVPPSSAAVHGLTADVLAGGSSPRVGLAVVLEWVQALVDRRVGLVVFNASYDLTMLRAEATRWGLDQPDWDRLIVVDPYVIGWGIAPRGRRPRKLTDVAAYYEVELDHAHDATADARAAREVAYEIGLRHPDIASGDLDSLMQRQREWFAARAEDWNAYAVTKDRPLDDPQGWPFAAPDPSAVRAGPV